MTVGSCRHVRGGEFGRWWRLRDRLSVQVMWLALKLEPKDTRPPCPDCGTPGYADMQGECPVCRDGWEEQERQRQIYEGAHADGYTEGLHDMAARYEAY